MAILLQLSRGYRRAGTWSEGGSRACPERNRGGREAAGKSV